MGRLLMKSSPKTGSPNQYWLGGGLGVGIVYGILVHNIGLGMIIGTLVGVAGDSFAVQKPRDGV